MKSFTFIIPTWNGAAFIGDCLSSLQPQLRGGDAIIVVDNGSVDGTPALVERQFPSVQVLRQDRNLGYSGGANCGMRLIRTDAAVILNQDVAFKEGCVSALRQRLERSGPAVIGCKLLYPDGLTIQHAGGIIRMPRGEPDHYGYHQIGDGGYEQLTEPDYVTGALFVIDNRVIETIGGFDEGFFPAYFEEVDYCYRAREAGFPIIYEPAGVAIHYESQTYGQHSNPYHQAMSRGRLRFLLKHLSTQQFCDEFVPAEKRWLTELTSTIYRRIQMQAYLHSILAVPHLQAQRLLIDSTPNSVGRLLDALVQLSHVCIGNSRL